MTAIPATKPEVEPAPASAAAAMRLELDRLRLTMKKIVKPHRVNLAESELMSQRAGRAELDKQLRIAADAMRRSSAFNRPAAEREVVVLDDQLKAADLRIKEARQRLAERRQADLLPLLAKTLEPHRRAAAEVIEEAVETIEAALQLLITAENFAARNGVELPGPSFDRPLDLAQMRRAARRLTRS